MDLTLYKEINKKLNKNEPFIKNKILYIKSNILGKTYKYFCLAEKVNIEFQSVDYCIIFTNDITKAETYYKVKIDDYYRIKINLSSIYDKLYLDINDELGSNIKLNKIDEDDENLVLKIDL